WSTIFRILRKTAVSRGNVYGPNEMSGITWRLAVFFERGRPKAKGPFSGKFRAAGYAVRLYGSATSLPGDQESCFPIGLFRFFADIAPKRLSNLRRCIPSEKTTSDSRFFCG